MKNKILLLALAFLAALNSLSTASAQGTAFTYQGRLTDQGTPANGVYDLQFNLYKLASDGSPQTGAVLTDDLAITNGLFTVTLDFGAGPFFGDDRWLDIAVRPGASSGDYTNLAPRQLITATPYAIRAANFSGAVLAVQITGKITGAQLAAGAVTAANIASNTITANQLAPGAALSNIYASGQSAVGSGGVILSKDSESSVLAQAGYVKIPDAAITLANEAWKSFPRGGAIQPNGVVWTGSEILVWPTVIGGVESKSVSRYVPAINTWTIAPETNAPVKVLGSAVWTGTEMILWGGMDESGLVNSGSRYKLSANSWTAVSTNGAPSPRLGHAAVWTGTEMIVWGGSDWDVGPTNSGGRYNPVSNSWVAMNMINAPPVHSEASVVWSGTEMIIWGGYDGDSTDETVYTAFNRGARYNPAANTWTTMTTNNAPSARYGHSAVWTGSEMIIFGGSAHLDYSASPPEPTSGGRYSPTSNTWLPIAPFMPGGSPVPRSFPSAVWTGSEMLIWGGLETSGDPYSEDYIASYPSVGGRYNPSANSWSVMNSTNAPTGRKKPIAFWTGSEMFIWGGKVGYTDNPGLPGRYKRSTDTWSLFNTVIEPEPRSTHSAVWTGTEMIIWGGTAAFGATMGDGWRFNPVANNWARINEGENLPNARYAHTAVWTGTEMIIWGGMSANGGPAFPINSGGRYNPIADIWQPTPTFGAPEARGFHTAIWTGSEMIVWGGNGVASPVNTGGRYNPITNTWTLTPSVNAPAPRFYHTAVWTGSSMIVWGGFDGEAVLNTGGRYTPGDPSWLSTPAIGVPAARLYHSAVWTGTEMIVWGGVSFTEQFNNGGRFSPAANTWQPTSLTGAPLSRYNHTAVWTGDNMLVWGGERDGIKLNTGSSYNPRDGTWVPLTLTDSPSIRSGHTAVWTGTQMLVWGGYDGSSYLNNGFSYAPQLKLYYYFRP